MKSMKMSVIVPAILAALALAACNPSPDSVNVADASNSAGAALENSAAELDATTDTLVEGEIANINDAANVNTATNTGVPVADNAVTK